MTTSRESLNPVGRYIDALADHGLNDVTENDLRSVERIYLEVEDACRADRASQQFTAEGLHVRAREREAKANERLKPFRDKIAAIDRRIETERAKAREHGRPKEHGVLQELRAREIRETLRAQHYHPDGSLDTLRLDTAYLAAIHEGHQTVALALEQEEFGLISAEARDVGDTLRIEVAPQYATIQELEAVRDAYSMVLGSAERGLSGIER